MPSSKKKNNEDVGGLCFCHLDGELVAISWDNAPSADFCFLYFVKGSFRMTRLGVR